MSLDHRLLSKKLVASVAFVLSLLFLSVHSLSTSLAKDADSEGGNLSPYVDDQGSISLPIDFRNTMTHLGSWYVPEGGASGFHDVYAEKESVDYYRLHGVFPDGATLVKELRAASTGDYTTGKSIAYANDQIKQWFVMIKDSQNRFDESDAWGDGWGWALFKSDSVNGEGEVENTVSNYQADCIGCHVPAQKNDWVYVEAYPSLLDPNS